MKSGAALGLGLLVGAAIGFGASLLVGSSASRAPGSPEAGAASPAPVAPPPPATPGLAPATPVPAAGREPALADLAPTREEADFLTRTLLEERRRLEAARFRPDDSGLEVLRRVLDERADPTDVLSDFDRFAARVRPATGRAFRFAAPTGDAPVVLRDSDAKDSTVLEFGPGRFVLDAAWWKPMKEEVGEVEIRGAGKEKTTLVLTRDLLGVPKRLESLHVHDLTLVTEQGETLDAREPLAAVFEDVRFLPWQAAGHASPIGVGSRVYAGFRRCEWFGGGPRAGFALSLRGQALVLAEDCLFADCEATVTGSPDGTGSVVRLVRCRFHGSALTDSRIGGRGEIPLASIRVSGGEALFRGPELDEASRRSSWGANFAASVEGVAFGPDPAAPTVRDLLEVLDRARADAPGTPIAVQCVAPPRLGQPGWFVVETWDGKSERPAIHGVRWADGRATVKRDPHGGGHRTPSAGDLDGVADLSDIVRRSDLPPLTPATELLLQAGRRADGSNAVVFVHAHRGIIAQINPKTYAVTLTRR